MKNGSKRIPLKNVLCSAGIWTPVTKTIEDVAADGFHFSFSNYDLTLESLVFLYKAVVSSTRQLVDVGRFIKLENCLVSPLCVMCKFTVYSFIAYIGNIRNFISCHSLCEPSTFRVHSMGAWRSTWTRWKKCSYTFWMPAAYFIQKCYNCEF